MLRYPAHILAPCDRPDMWSILCVQVSTAGTTHGLHSGAESPEEQNVEDSQTTCFVGSVTQYENQAPNPNR